jgi:23S rRNA-/tRNA-specific pseudouridylate synthase
MSISTRIVSAKQSGLRLYKFSQLNFPEWLPSKRRSILAIRAGELRVNGQAVEETRILHEGDHVELCKDIRQQAIHELERLCTIAYQTPVLDTLDRSENLSSSYDSTWSFSVVWKPAGVASQELELVDTKLQGLTNKTTHNTQAVYWLEKAACGWVSS